MSTAKTGLAVPFNPPDNPTKTHRPRKRNSNNSNSSSNNQNNSSTNNNNQSSNRRIERSSSSNSLSNGLNNNSSSNQNGGGTNTNTNNEASKANRQRRNGPNAAAPAAASASVPKNDSAGTPAQVVAKAPLATSTSGSERSRRGYLSNRSSASAVNRLDQDPVSRARPGTTPSTCQGRLFDPKKDPIVPRPTNNNSSSNINNSNNGGNNNNGVASPQSVGDAKSLGTNNPHQRQRSGASTQRLYDPNQPQSSPYQGMSTTAAASPTASPAAISSASTSSSSTDPLVRLTKEIQQLEKKVMEKPSRRTLDDDDDVLGSVNHRLGGHLGWSARIDTSKRLAYKYLKLLQLDFKSSLKHDIDTRCWRLAIYPLIEAFRAALRSGDQSGESEGSHHSQSDHDEDLQESVRHHFGTFIGFAQEFYETLKSVLQTLEAKYGTPPGTGGDPRVIHPPRWHRCIGILGDLARYRWLHRLNGSEDGTKSNVDWLVAARKIYREAIDLGPGNGKMYNQLALLSGGRGLDSLYYYSKRQVGLSVKSSFMNARETLMAFFSANDQIKAFHALSLKSANARKAALMSTTMQDCEGSYLYLQAMLFGKINLEVFEKRFRTLEKQLRHVHQRRISNNSDNNVTLSTATASTNNSGSQDIEDMNSKDRNAMSWERFYFMMAVTNLAALYEFNWTASVIAKSATAFGPMKDHLATVSTLPYSSKLLFSTMEQAMQRYLTSMGENQKVFSSTLEEQRGWLFYCLVVLIWMSSRPFGSKEEGMMDNWLMLANHESLPTFWGTLVRFMNYHWTQMTPFEQSDLLSNMSEELSAVETGYSKGTSEGPQFSLSAPLLGSEWELRGLAWVPYSRYGRLFKEQRPALDDSELKDGDLWRKGSVKMEDLSKRLVELSFISALRMEIIEFDFCDNAFKVNEIYLAELEELMPTKTESGLSTSHLTVNDGFTSDDAVMSPSHVSSSYEDAIEDGESLDEDDLYWDGMHDMDPNDPAAEILELRSKRDRLRSMSVDPSLASRRDGRTRGSQRNLGSGGGKAQQPKSGNRATGSRGYMERRQQHHRQNGDLHQQRAAMVTENSTLVVDTNCLISDWTIVQRLVNADRWTVIIPLAVITELDGLKNNPAPLGPAATAAITYLEGCMALPKAKRPKRLKIQTSRGNYMNDLSFRVESFGYDQQQQQQQYQQQQQSSPQSSHRRKTTGPGEGEGSTGSEQEDGEDDDDEMIMRNRNVDDFILSLCLWHQEHGQNTWSQQQSTLQQGVFLVTDDRNLRVKARARMVEVLGKDDVTVLTAGRHV
ncbi:hypothetical protein BGW38_000912 [Lunasporangiospora selenospora]|uniref:PIN domain-containing protein n=1 Tax=Lunasporangiospora selenospora TaxID=979761 RepID=A0A9P6KEG9_9FUNG|nr:hypothetical protein BGW38_000912 [Lunasporangiospora selenospora]